MTTKKTHNARPLSFQDMILATSKFWADYGCSLLQSYDIEMGAGTLSPHTALKLVASQKNGTPLNSCYLQYSRRPTDARYATNPNRLSSYYQTQVILSPAPNNVQQLIIESLERIGISSTENEIRFVEDNWENESIGAFGLGWECWLNGMEIIQVTFMKEIGGVELFPHPCEITYGTERIAMLAQNVDTIFDIVWNYGADGVVGGGAVGDAGHVGDVKYGDIHTAAHEIEQSSYLKEYSENTDFILACFHNAIEASLNLSEKGLILPAYEQCLKASNYLNILDARGAIDGDKRREFILLSQKATCACCQKHFSM